MKRRAQGHGPARLPGGEGRCGPRPKARPCFGNQTHGETRDRPHLDGCAPLSAGRPWGGGFPRLRGGSPRAAHERIGRAFDGRRLHRLRPHRRSRNAHRGRAPNHLGCCSRTRSSFFRGTGGNARRAADILPQRPPYVRAASEKTGGGKNMAFARLLGRTEAGERSASSRHVPGYGRNSHDGYTAGGTLGATPGTVRANGVPVRGHSRARSPMSKRVNVPRARHGPQDAVPRLTFENRAAAREAPAARIDDAGY